jgi:hypothetical protein
LSCINAVPPGETLVLQAWMKSHGLTPAAYGAVDRNPVVGALTRSVPVAGVVQVTEKLTSTVWLATTVTATAVGCATVQLVGTWASAMV